jgi:hypothetical protein
MAIAPGVLHCSKNALKTRQKRNARDGGVHSPRSVPAPQGEAPVSEIVFP